MALAAAGYGVLQSLRHLAEWPDEWRIGRGQWWSARRLARRCDADTRALLRFCAGHVPYWRSLFAQLGVDPAGEFRENWARVPVLTKNDLREHFDALRANTVHGRSARRGCTGGSTGQPVEYLFTLRAARQMNAFMRTVFRWAGWRPGEPVLFLWGDARNVPDAPGRLRALRLRASGQLYFPVYDYDERSFARWRDAIRRWRPSIVYAYPSVAADFARWTLARGEPVAGVRGVFCSAEILYPEHRDAIERAFGCKVFNQYGSREAPGIACECGHGGMHVFTPINRVEYGAPDEIGLSRIIVTPLNNLAQPLLRYDLGDLVRPLPGPCACGRGLPLLAMEVGRSNDHVVGIDGRSVYPSFFVHLMDESKWVRRFQFRQTARESIELLVEPAESTPAEVYDALGRTLQPRIAERMGGPVRLVVHPVDQLERTKLGKHRYVVNAIER